MNFKSAFLLGSLLTVSSLGFPADLAAQNSTRKVRATPNDLALSSGSAIAWREDVHSALKEGKRSKKPIFWYVPTLEGSFMDRQLEVDRYMMSGPFSWPRLVQTLNEDYIPVRAVADRKLCKEFELKPVAFIEPGFLVFSSKGKETLRLDRIATLHPDWFLTQLHGETIAANPFPGNLKMETASRLHRSFPKLENGASLFEKLLPTLTPELQAEALWLFAAGLRDAHEEEAARTLLKRLITKAAMELAGNGPYWQGFESYVDLPAPARTSAASGTLAAPGTYDLEDLRDRANDFLLRAQLADGSWKDSRYDFGGTDSMPNVHAAITAICTHALTAKEPGVARSVAQRRALSYLANDAVLNLKDSDELIWAYLYRTRLYCHILDVHPDQKAMLQPLLEENVAGIVRMQAESGAWYHEYENPFLTASCLIALHAAAQHGVDPASMEKVVERGLIQLEASRSKKGAYSYYLSRGKVRTPVEASVGRSPVGEHARQLWGVAGKKDLADAVANSFRDQEPLLLARKYDDHTDTHAYGGFFFWYSMLGRTEAILALPKGAQRKKFHKRQKDLILSLPEIDGAFIDSHELGRSYGTAMALWCLDLLQDEA